MATWVDLLDPTPAQVREALPAALPESLATRLSARAEREPRPRIMGGDGWIAAILVVMRAVVAEDRVYTQEVAVVATRETALTIRWTPTDGEPFVVDDLPRGAVVATGTVLHQVLDDVAECYLDLLDDLSEEVEELEDVMDDAPPEDVRRRLADLRHDMLHIRRTLAPTRDAVRRLVDGRADTGAEPVVDRALRPDLADAYEKLLRATESLDFARDLVTAAREFHQARIAQDQNDVIRKLTVIASLLLFPTFLVGVYGQNFEHMPELGWRLGYAWSWGIVVGATIVQLALFRWRRWI